MATTAKAKETTSRTVVLLRASAKRKLEKLAAKEKVSAGEIIRRSLESYASIEARVRKEEEEKWVEATLAMLTEALAGANRSLENSCNRLDELHLQLNPQERSSEHKRELLQRRETTPADRGEHQAA